MAAKSKRRKVVKPRKPYPGFPVNFHNSGRFAKKLRVLGKANAVLFYYGRRANVRNGELVPVEDMPQAIAEAKATFERYWPFDSTGNLQKGHLDLARSRLEMPRVKTAIDRICPLWPETVAAIKAAIAVRPDPKSPDDDDSVSSLETAGDG
ncbi:MAG TPA: hypothetical protein VM510_00790 [Caulifigura sp.]|jgi:hypothetical protein|nr:hypothetical protein [Caulifigura sp.]